MRITIGILLVAVVGGFAVWRWWRSKRPISLAKARRKMYKQLDAQAARGDSKAMYHLAELFYKEKDAQYYPIIFKWVQVLARQTKDPSVLLMLGDLFLCGCGTEQNLQKALSNYEEALSQSIILGRDTPLSPEAYNYLESQIIQTRKALDGQTN
ncbi:MAG: hypothetical protein J6U96_00660 [Elusimicrobiaceae bacterium]|nr:hypothetical protein [Elusimicrobiaceae bacterium]